MSVINDMLRDLERREAQDPALADAEGIATTGSPERRRGRGRPWVVFLGGLLALAVVGAGWFGILPGLPWSGSGKVVSLTETEPSVPAAASAGADTAGTTTTVSTDPRVESVSVRESGQGVTVVLTVRGVSSSVTATHESLEGGGRLRVEGATVARDLEPPVPDGRTLRLLTIGRSDGDAVLRYGLVPGGEVSARLVESGAGDITVFALVLTPAPAESDRIAPGVSSGGSAAATPPPEQPAETGPTVEANSESAGPALPPAPVKPGPEASGNVDTADAAAPPNTQAASGGAPDNGGMVRQQRPRSAAERADALYADALDALDAGRLNAAIDAAERSLSLQPSHGAARELQATLLYREGRTAEARASLETAFAEYRATPDMLQLYARLRLEEGDLEAAIATLERGVQGGLAISAGYRATLAAFYQRAGRHAEASEQYRAALGNRPSQGAWWAGLGISLESLGEGVEAAAAYRRALRVGVTPSLRDYISDRLRVVGE